jgi:hypothetical protein
MVGVTTTIVCENCKRLYDVLTADSSKSLAPVPVRCPKAKKHAVRQWTHPRPCPRCGTTMKLDKNGVQVLWD